MRWEVESAKFKPVIWYKLSYGPSQNGRKIFERDLTFADIFILLNEMDDSLNALGAPL